MGITQTEYTQLLFDSLGLISDMIKDVDSSAHVETRYIASEGKNDEQWLAYLRDENNIVDIWLLTFVGLTGLKEEDDRKGAVGTFTKPSAIVVDYFADYRQGVDAVGALGSETSTNTEREFLKKVFGLDYMLENQKGCLLNNILIRDWNFQLKLRRFDTATTHWASGIINLEFSELFLNS